MLLRVRTNVGLWRVEVNDNTATVADVLAGIAATRPHVVYESPLSLDPACKQPLSEGLTLKDQNLSHGAMIHVRVDASTAVNTEKPAAEQPESAPPSSSGNMRRVVDKDGQIRLVPSNEVKAEAEKGFRKGMMALRDMKMQWTLNDFVALDSQFEFKLQRQEAAICRQASLDVATISNFQLYCQQFHFQRKQIGYCYGMFVQEDDEWKVKVEAIYEPPQQIDADSPEGYELLEDPMEEKVEQLAELLGLKRVGWILCHPFREGYVLSSSEIITAAELQLEAADGVKETPFCTIVVAPKADGVVSVEAFQVSQQCMAMVAEQALEIGDDPKVCVVNETFTAIQEGKESKTVENSFFVTVVPIAQHTSEMLVADFPRANRDLQEKVPSNDEMRRQLNKAGQSGWTFVDRLADFNLLIYLSQFLDMSADFPKICASIADRSVPLDDGYKLIIKGLAGMEGSY